MSDRVPSWKIPAFPPQAGDQKQSTRLTAEEMPESSSWEHVGSGSLSGWLWPVPSAQCSPHPLQSGRINQQQVTGPRHARVRVRSTFACLEPPDKNSACLVEPSTQQLVSLKNHY